MYPWLNFRQESLEEQHFGRLACKPHVSACVYDVCVHVVCESVIHLKHHVCRNYSNTTVDPI